MDVVARPTLLTDEVREELEDALPVGTAVRIAAASVGVSRPTVYEWISRGLVERRPRLRLVEEETPHTIGVSGEDAEEDPAEVGRRIERACLACLLRAIQNGDTRAAIFLLRAKFPKKWGIR